MLRSTGWLWGNWGGPDLIPQGVWTLLAKGSDLSTECPQARKGPRAVVLHCACAHSYAFALGCSHSHDLCITDMHARGRDTSRETSAPDRGPGLSLNFLASLLRSGSRQARVC